MLGQVQKGNKRDKSFTRAAWKEMIKLLNKKFNLQLDKDILQNRHKKLRKQWGILKDIIEQTGFSWDPNKQMVTVEDSFIMTHPKADNYRRQTQPDYNALCRIFHDNTADVKYNGGIIDVDVGHKKFTPTDATEPAFVSQRMPVGKDAELDDAHDSS